MNIPNSDDLVIVRRGDVEALKQEAIFGVFRRDAVEWDKLNALLSNAPVVSGEPYGDIDTAGNLVKDANINSMLARGEELTPYYLTPQPTPSADDVKDAERYRWLRDHYQGFEHYRKNSVETVTLETLDSDIDKAIAQEVK